MQFFDRVPLDQMMRGLAQQIRTDKLAQTCLILIFLGNFLFVIGSSLVHAWYWDLGLTEILSLHYSAFNVSTERSIPEIFNYAQTLATAGLLLACSFTTTEWAYGAWAVIFVFMAADDFFRLHENFGESAWTTANLPALPGLEPRDSGALVLWATTGFVLFGLLGISLRYASKETRAASLVVFGLFGFVLFFAIGVDALHVIMKDTSPRIDRLFEILEDGGEMAAIGVCLAVSLLWYRRLNWPSLGSTANNTRTGSLERHR